MRFGALPAYVILGASLAASASPIRVVVTEVRYGHIATDNNNVAHIPPSHSVSVPSVSILPILHEGGDKQLNHHGGKGHHLCESMRAKALDASNTLRQWLGLDPIHVDSGAPMMHHAHHSAEGKPVGFIEPVPMPMPTRGHDQKLPILPFVGTPVRPAFNIDATEDDRALIDVQRGEWRGEGRRPMWIHRHNARLNGSFLRRVHHALMALGPWEGRAVAFVLGCGIGVLLRMVWVVILVTARAFRGTRDDENEYDVVFDEAEILVPPPQYTIIEGTEAVPVAIPADEKADKVKESTA